MTLDYSDETIQFDVHWQNQEYALALAVYYAYGRPFWLTDMVADYYERKGLINRAMEEYEYLIGEYLKIRPDFLPFPNGPRELYLLGRWYASKDKTKAKKYLKLYLDAEAKHKTEPALYLPYKHKARKLLRKLNSITKGNSDGRVERP